MSVHLLQINTDSSYVGGKMFRKPFNKPVLATNKTARMCPSAVNTGKLKEGNLVGKSLSIWKKATSFQLNSNFMATQPS